MFQAKDLKLVLGSRAGKHDWRVDNSFEPLLANCFHRGSHRMTAKTIKRLAILIIILGLIGGAAIWAQRYQLTKMAASVRAQAKLAEKLAEKTGNLSEAESLYQQYLEVVPDDTDTKLQYADLMAKSDNALKQQEALALYSTVLKRNGGLTGVRRKRMDLQYKLNNFPAAQRSGSSAGRG